MSDEIEAHILERYKIIQKLGKGAYGIVWKAEDKKTKQLVALKKVYDAFQNSTDAQRTYREVMYLQHLNGHENIIRLLSIIRAHNNKDLYLVFDLMETDLHVVIRAKILKDIHKKFVMYQLFKSLKYLHSADLVHRDLKPSNMLINSDCTMKLADFGLARSIIENNSGEPPIVSDYIATRWYRAPEILLGSQVYTKAVDLWSSGCILAEVLIEQVLFPGKSSLNQIELIIELLGRPSKKDLEEMQISFGNNSIDGLKTTKIKSITHMFNNCDPQGIDLLRKLLIYNPNKRITVKEALEHPFFKDFHSVEDEIVCKSKIQIPIDDNQKLSLKVYRDSIYEIISDKIKEQSNLKKNTCEIEQENLMKNTKNNKRSNSNAGKLFNNKKSLINTKSTTKCKSMVINKIKEGKIGIKNVSSKKKFKNTNTFFFKKKSLGITYKENKKLFKSKKSKEKFKSELQKKKTLNKCSSKKLIKNSKIQILGPSNIKSTANMKSYLIFKNNNLNL
jgi:mitogen-activated protein kinase 15